MTDHLEWKARGEAHLAKGHLRRALGAFRKSQETDQRGEQAFALHTLINAVSTVLLQQQQFFLHVHDEAQLARDEAPAEAPIDGAALASDAVALRGEVNSSLHPALESIIACARAGQLLPQYADQSPAAELEQSSHERARAFAKRWRHAQAVMYRALLEREEPLK